MKKLSPKLIILLALLFSCGSESTAPVRPSAVPAEAVWVEGENEKGIWAECGMFFKEPIVIYRCDLFSHPTGERLDTDGEWILVKGPVDDPKPLEGPFWSGMKPKRFEKGVLWINSSLRLIPVQEAKGSISDDNEQRKSPNNAIKGID